MKPGKPLARHARLVRRKGINRISAKRRQELPARAEIRAEVIARDGTCRVAPLVDSPCFGPLTFHHLRKEGQGGTYTAANGLTACAFHNGWIEDHPAEAYRLGLVVKPWEAA